MRGAGRLITTLGMAAIVAVVMAACGSGAEQNANEPSGKFPVAISAATFPAQQRLSEHTKLTIKVRNMGSKTIPDVAVTICNVTCAYPAPVGEGTSVAAFADYFNMPDAANHSRPVWIVERPPGPCKYSCQQGGEGSYFTDDANTWAAGSLKPGASATFTWAVTAVAPGRHVVAWEVAAGLHGKAKAVLRGGGRPHGAFTVNISHNPSSQYVNDSGQVVTGH